MKSRLSGSDTVWTISALNFEVKTLLSQGIGSLWIEGEVSNFACPPSGHWYFTLKDERAQCRAAMFKGRHNRVGFIQTTGQNVLIRAPVTLYEARGEYQLVARRLEIYRSFLTQMIPPPKAQTPSVSRVWIFDARREYNVKPEDKFSIRPLELLPRSVLPLLPEPIRPPALPEAETEADTPLIPARDELAAY